jgi:hypothetical protein
MNKKANTLLFILGATLFNILVTVAAFLLLLALYAKFLMPALPESAQAWAIPLLFIAAIVVSFVVYRFALNLLLKKIDMDRYFDPIFTSRRRR